MKPDIKQILTKRLRDINSDNQRPGDTSYMTGYREGIEFVIEIINIEDEEKNK